MSCMMVRWIIWFSVLREEPSNIFLGPDTETIFPIFKFVLPQNFRDRCCSGYDTLLVTHAEPHRLEQAFWLLITFSRPLLSWGQLTGSGWSAREAKCFSELLHSHCTLCFCLFTFIQHVKHLPFSITDHFLGLGFAAVSFFPVDPAFSKRLYEVWSLLAFGFFRLFGRKQNGIAARKLITPLIKNPSHHAPTQRESCGVIVMLPRIQGNRCKLPKWISWTLPAFIC